MSNRTQRERISAYLDGELPDEERIAFEKAMAEDAALQREVEDCRGVDALFWALPREDAPSDLLRRVQDALDDADARPEPIRFRRRLQPRAATPLLASAAVLLVVIGVVIYQFASQPDLARRDVAGLAESDRSLPEGYYEVQMMEPREDASAPLAASGPPAAEEMAEERLEMKMQPAETPPTDARLQGRANAAAASEVPAAVAQPEAEAAAPPAAAEAAPAPPAPAAEPSDAPEPAPAPSDDALQPQVMAYGEPDFRAEQPNATPPASPEGTATAPTGDMMGGFGGGIAEGVSGMGGMPGGVTGDMTGDMGVRGTGAVPGGSDGVTADAAAPVGAPLRLLAGPRAFDRVNDEWRQRGYAGEEAPAIARDSEAFTQLVRRYPELAVLALQPDAAVFSVDGGWRRLEPAPKTED